MMRADFHTHTTFCDGKNTPREMVEAAYRMGFTDFGISGHADFSMVEPGFGMSDEALKAYKEELLALREEYAGRMNLYIGIELDVLGPIQKAEYAIGSVHAVEKHGEIVCVDDT
ncbi:MAG: PHP domain-containing protein, partial [Otoolea sp.]